MVLSLLLRIVYSAVFWLGLEGGGSVQFNKLLGDHWPKVLLCITLVFDGTGVMVAWIYVNTPKCAHDLGQFVL